MEIKTFIEGPVGTNMYIASEADDCVIIDPAFYDEDAVRYIMNTGLSLRAILLTHAHFDHTLGLSDYLDIFSTDVYLAEADREMLYVGEKDASAAFGIRYKVSEIPQTLPAEDGQVIELGKLCFRVIATPGHTRGSVCYLSEKDRILFSGDTLFFAGAGRTDLYSGSYIQLMSSIQTKLMSLPDDTEVLSGHGRRTTIENERRYY
ncbi:MAG: MBL fold metallo-hydrolase [Eubacteriaceae bacterium]|nr:MBL fold metallo-hydrolase [Eubacteriaceae bacterium]